MARPLALWSLSSLLCVVLWLPAEQGSAQVITLAEEPGDLMPLLEGAVRSGDPAQALNPHDDESDEFEDDFYHAQPSTVPSGVAPDAPQDDAKSDEVDDAESDVADDAEDAHVADEDGESTEIIRERYPNRAVRIERGVIQDEQGNYVNHGTWKMWDPRGDLIAEGQYHQGERHGTWNSWHLQDESKLYATLPYNQFSGPFVSQAGFKDGKLHGKWTIYDSKQRKISEWEFVDGYRDGKSLWWYADGRKMQEIDYRDGAVEGKLLRWGPDAKLLTNETYQGGRKLATKIEYHRGDQKRWEGMYLYAKLVMDTPDDWWNCVPATFKTDGKDEKHGLWTAWFPNGQKQVEGRYENDVPVGRFTWWYSNGQKQAEGEYVSGKQNGTFIWWHPNGQKQREGDFSASVRSGKWTLWAADGKVIGKEDYTGGTHFDAQSPTVADQTPESDEDQPQSETATPRVAPHRF